MSNRLAWKWGFIIAILLGSLYLIYPNYKWYSKPLAERETLDSMGERPKRMLNLGLDLRGGSSLLLELEVAKWKETYNAYDAVKTSLVNIVNKYLDADGMTIDFTDSEQFEKDLRNAAIQWEAKVANAEYQLAEAQVELEKAMDGKYDAVYYAQAQVDLATYNFNKGWEAYQEALDNLNTALAVIAADEEGGNAEQPGDGNEDPAGEEEQPAE